MNARPPCWASMAAADYARREGLADDRESAIARLVASDYKPPYPAEFMELAFANLTGDTLQRLAAASGSDFAMGNALGDFLRQFAWDQASHDIDHPEVDYDPS